MRVAWIKSRWGVLVLLQVAVIIAVGIWGWRTIQDALVQAEDFRVPERCPNGHTTIVIVDIVYGQIQDDGKLDQLPVQVKGGPVSGPASPAFLFRCTTCGWEEDGWSIETVLKMQGRGELPKLPGMND